MGCDIHFVVEKRINDRWIGIFKKWPRSGFAGERDYDFFAEIAAVRGSSETSAYPRFLPEGISELALAEITHDGTDGHSHSWMTIKEFSEAKLRVSPDRFKRQDEPWEDLFGDPIFLNTDKDKIEDYRIVFWFDN